MLSSFVKQGFLLALITAFLVGCSSTSTTDDMAAGDNAGMESGVSTGTARGAGLSGADMMDEPALDLATVFYFDFDQSLLSQETRSLLVAHANYLKSNPRAVRLEGHADERGTREYNMALGERRARAVRDFLVLQGVDPGMIEVVSYGEEYPAVMGSTEASYSKNRRVELK